MKYLILIMLLALPVLAFAAVDPTKNTEIDCNGILYRAKLSCTSPQNAMGSSGTEFWADPEGTQGGSGCSWSVPIVSIHNFDRPRPGYTPYPSNENIPLFAPLGVARSYGPSLAPTITGFQCVCPGNVVEEFILQVPPIHFSPPKFAEYGSVYLVWGGIEHVLARTTRAEGQAIVQVVFNNGYYHVPADQVTHNGEDSNPHLRSDGKIDVIGTQDCQENRTILGGIGKTGLGTGQTDYEYDHIPLGYAGTRPRSFPTIHADHWPPSRYGKWINFCKDYPDYLPNAAVIKGNARYAPDWQGSPSMPIRNVKVHVFELDSWNHPRYVAGQSLTVGATINPSDVKWATPASGAAQQARLVVSDFANPNRKRIFDNPSISGGTVSANWDGKLYDGGNTSGTPYDLAGCDYKLELTCWFENYYWNPVGGGQAVLDNRQFDFREIGARLESVTFSGAGRYFDVLPDPGDPGTPGFPDYGVPHWSRDRLIIGYSSSPIGYRKESELTVEVEICIVPAGGPYLIRGSSTEGPALTFNATSASLVGTTIGATLTSAEVLPDMIQAVDIFTIAWECSLDGGVSWIEVGSSTNQLYVTLDTPLLAELTNVHYAFGLPLATSFHTLVDLGCRSAAGESTESGAFAKIWTAFSTLDLKTVSGKELSYWKGMGDTPDATVTYQLLAEGDAECRAWAYFLIDTNKAIGSASHGALHRYEPMPPVDLLFIADWRFSITHQTSGDPLFPFLNLYSLPPENWGFLTSQGYSWVYAEVTDEPGKAGQGNGNANPQSVFIRHFWVERNLSHYDPSYGEEYPDGEQSFKESALLFNGEIGGGTAKIGVKLFQGNAYSALFLRGQP